ncbi:cell wall anchor protein, partial [Staphylococcus epidermidis]
NEASKIAKKLAHSHLSNTQIVNQLKRDFDKKGNATSDDILNGVLNNAKNKKEAIETILATRLNQEKAKMLAEVISRLQNDKSD